MQNILKAQTASRLKEIIYPPSIPPPPDFVFWNKNFLKEIYWNIQTLAFKVLQECSYWASRNDVIQFFFWHQVKTCLLENLWSGKGFWLCCGSILFSMPSEYRIVKWARFFERNFIVKCLIFFASFCWLWDFLLENLKLKENSDDAHWNVWTNIKTYARNDFFKKRILNMRFWIIYNLVEISNFFLDCFRAL